MHFSGQTSAILYFFVNNDCACSTSAHWMSRPGIFIFTVAIFPVDSRKKARVWGGSPHHIKMLNLINDEVIQGAVVCCLVIYDGFFHKLQYCPPLRRVDSLDEIKECYELA